MILFVLLLLCFSVAAQYENSATNSETRLLEEHPSECSEKLSYILSKFQKNLLPFIGRFMLKTNPFDEPLKDTFSDVSGAKNHDLNFDTVEDDSQSHEEYSNSNLNSWNIQESADSVLRPELNTFSVSHDFSPSLLQFDTSSNSDAKSPFLSKNDILSGNTNVEILKPSLSKYSSSLSVSENNIFVLLRKYFPSIPISSIFRFSKMFTTRFPKVQQINSPIVSDGFSQSQIQILLHLFRLYLQNDHKLPQNSFGIDDYIPSYFTKLEKVFLKLITERCRQNGIHYLIECLVSSLNNPFLFTPRTTNYLLNLNAFLSLLKNQNSKKLINPMISWLFRSPVLSNNDKSLLLSLNKQTLSYNTDPAPVLSTLQSKNTFSHSPLHLLNELLFSKSNTPDTPLDEDNSSNDLPVSSASIPISYEEDNNSTSQLPYIADNPLHAKSTKVESQVNFPLRNKTQLLPLSTTFSVVTNNAHHFSSNNQHNSKSVNFQAIPMENSQPSVLNNHVALLSGQLDSSKPNNSESVFSDSLNKKSNLALQSGSTHSYQSDNTFSLKPHDVHSDSDETLHYPFDNSYSLESPSICLVLGLGNCFSSQLNNPLDLAPSSSVIPENYESNHATVLSDSVPFQHENNLSLQSGSSVISLLNNLLNIERGNVKLPSNLCVKYLYYMLQQLLKLQRLYNDCKVQARRRATTYEARNSPRIKDIVEYSNANGKSKTGELYGAERGECEFQGMGIEDRIIGGRIVLPGELPYQVALYKLDIFMCGSSLISPYYILTAGHCLINAEPDELWFRVGSAFLTKGGKTYKVSSIAVHDRYTSGDNDIGLIKSASRVNFDSHVKPIPLPSAEDPPISLVTPVEASGWGAISLQNGSPPVYNLHKLELRIATRKRCRSRIMASSRTISERQICTVAPANTGTCFGDSGGPLVANGKLIGIISWGSPCAIGDPDVYTNVQKFLPWIYRTIRDIDDNSDSNQFSSYSLLPILRKVGYGLSHTPN